MKYLCTTKYILLNLFFAFLFFNNAEIVSQVSDEYMVKAVLIEKITRFVEWPESSSLKNNSANFRLYVFGKNPFDNLLDLVYKNQKINGRDVEIKYINEVNDINDCHLLYITKHVDSELNDIIAFTRDKPILTVAEKNGHGEKGVIINFLIKNNKIAFEINETALKKSNLYMSFRLLSRAKIINPISESTKER